MDEQTTQPSKKLDALKDKILKALNERSRLDTNEPLEIVGFSSILMQDDFQSYAIGGPSIPVVIVVGQRSGKISQFAVKALVPDAEL